MLRETLQADLVKSMKEKNEFELGVLRMLSSALQNRTIEKRTKGSQDPLTDEEVMEVLSREVKKRKEAANLFKEGAREDLAEKETKEADFIAKYLPKQLSEEEVTVVVKKVIEGGDKDFGAVMKKAMAELKGKADGKLVSEIIKKML